MNGTELGRVFADAEVARLYDYREPYPDEVFSLLARLIVEPRTVLDAGAGTGALARGMVRVASRVDALDPSTAMIEAGKRLPAGDDARLRWIVGRAEDAPLEPPYGLIACGASLHWMEHDVVLPRFRDALAPGGRLAIVDNENVYRAVPAREEALSVIKRYSPIRDHVSTRTMVERLVASGRLTLEGQITTAPIPSERSINDYLHALGSTSTLSRATLGERADDFEREMRGVFARHGIERVRYDVVAFVSWGRPT